MIMGLWYLALGWLQVYEAESFQEEKSKGERKGREPLTSAPESDPRLVFYFRCPQRDGSSLPAHRETGPVSEIAPFVKS